MKSASICQDLSQTHNYLISLPLCFQIKMEEVERFAFYERAKKAFAVVHTGYYNAFLRVHDLLHSMVIGYVLC